MNQFDSNQVSQHEDGECNLYDQYQNENDDSTHQILAEQFNAVNHKQEKQIITQIQEEQQCDTNVPSQIGITHYLTSKTYQIIKKKLDEYTQKQEMERSLKQSMEESMVESLNQSMDGLMMESMDGLMMESIDGLMMESLKQSIQAKWKQDKQQQSFANQDFRVICLANKEDRKGYLQFIIRLIHSFQFTKLQLSYDLIHNSYVGAWKVEKLN